jgi:hypothetical protein
MRRPETLLDRQQAVASAQPTVGVVRAPTELAVWRESVRANIRNVCPPPWGLNMDQVPSPALASALRAVWASGRVRYRALARCNSRGVARPPRRRSQATSRFLTRSSAGSGTGGPGMASGAAVTSTEGTTGTGWIAGLGVPLATVGKVSLGWRGLLGDALLGSAGADRASGR